MDWGHLHVRCGDDCTDDPHGHHREYEVICWQCEGFDPRKQCKTCGGRTTLVMRHCPDRLHEQLGEVMRAYRGLKKGFLPVSGGYMDQSRTFLVAVDWIERIGAFHKRRHAET